MFLAICFCRVVTFSPNSCPNDTTVSVPWNLPCSANVSLNDRLSLFSGWRGQKGDDGAGLWHLMSGCPTGIEVGVAWVSTLWVAL